MPEKSVKTLSEISQWVKDHPDMKKGEVPVFYRSSQLKAFKALTGSDGKLNFQGYANANIVDRDQDCLDYSYMPKALENYVKNAVILLEHGMAVNEFGIHEPIGKMLSQEVDDIGLFVKGEIGNTTKMEQYANHKVASGYYNALSVAFRPTKEWEVVPMKAEDGSKFFMVKGYEIYEISLVAVPANQDSIIQVSKSLKVTPMVEDSMKKADAPKEEEKPKEPIPEDKKPMEEEKPKACAPEEKPKEEEKKTVVTEQKSIPLVPQVDPRDARIKALEEENLSLKKSLEAPIRKSIANDQEDNKKSLKSWAFNPSKSTFANVRDARKSLINRKEE